MSGLLALPKTLKIIRYPEDKNLHQVTDFISSEGKKIFAQMKDGDNMPPPNWVSKEQWSHNLLTMCFGNPKNSSQNRNCVVARSLC